MSAHSRGDHSIAVIEPHWAVRLLRRLGRRLERRLRLSVRAAGRGFMEFYNSDDLTFAASIAYYALLSLFPFSLLVLAGLNMVTVGERGASLLHVLAAAMPANLDFLKQIEDFGPQALQLGVMGTLVTLWASMGVFGALTSAVNHAWGVEQPPGFFRHKLIAFGMLLASGVLMVIALLLISAAQVSDTGWFGNMAVRWPWVAEARGFLVQNAATPIFMLVVGLIYYYAPNAKVRLRDVWVGAFLAAVLWRGAFALLSWYLRDLSRFSMHGSVSTVIAFLAWVYVSAVILLYGAEVSAAYARLRKQIPQTRPAAPERDPVPPPAENAPI